MQGIFCSLSCGEKQCNVLIFCFVRFCVRFLFTWFYFSKFLFLQSFISDFVYVFFLHGFIFISFYFFKVLFRYGFIFLSFSCIVV